MTFGFYEKSCISFLKTIFQQYYAFNFREFLELKAKILYLWLALCRFFLKCNDSEVRGGVERRAFSVAMVFNIFALIFLNYFYEGKILGGISSYEELREMVFILF